MKFEDCKSIKFWMAGIANRSESTKATYLAHMKRFCKAVGHDPDELYEMRKQDLKSEDEREHYRMENMLKVHISELEKQGKSIATLKNRYASVRSFFDYNRVKLDLRRADAPSGESIGKNPAEKAQIKKMIDVADPFKFRCLVSFLKDIGWRLSDVLTLKWGDINDMDDGYWNFKKITKKKKVKANGFVGPETTELMKLYRNKRERAGEVITDNSPLFLSEKDGGHYKSLTFVSWKISNIAELAGARNVSAHSLRKYFQHTLEAPELHIQKTWIKQMIGKKLNPGDAPYVEHRTEKLFQAYKRAYEQLSLIEVVKSEDAEINNLINLAIARGMPPEKATRLREVWRSKKMIPRECAKDLHEKLKSLDEGKTEPNGGCANGHNCQKIVSEDELPTCLANGWRVSAVLPSGRVVVEK